jgi:hypothetical protein
MDKFLGITPMLARMEHDIGFALRGAFLFFGALIKSPTRQLNANPSWGMIGG